MTKGLKGFQKGNKHWCERKTHSQSDKTKRKLVMLIRVKLPGILGIGHMNQNAYTAKRLLKKV